MDIQIPFSSAAKMSKLDYYADGTLIITFPSHVHEVLTGIIEYIRDQMWDHEFYWDAWSDDKDSVSLSKSISIPSLDTSDYAYFDADNHPSYIARF